PVHVASCFFGSRIGHLEFGPPGDVCDFPQVCSITCLSTSTARARPGNIPATSCYPARILSLDLLAILLRLMVAENRPPVARDVVDVRSASPSPLSARRSALL